MSCSTYYVQECPTCGRTLQVRVEYLGKTVSCQHCAASFCAEDASSEDFDPMKSGISLIDRAEELILASAAAARVSPGALGRKLV